MDIDLDIEKQITELQEAKIQQNLKKVVPEDFDTQLGTFFSTIQEEKIELKEKVQKDEIKIKQFEKLFSELNVKKEAVKEKKIEKKKEPKRDEASAIKTQEVEAASSLLEYLLPKEVEKYDDNIINKVSKQISEMQVATELDKDRIKKLEKLDTLEKLKMEFLSFRDTVSKQMGTIGGGGETQLKFLDDVDTSSQQNGFALKFNSSTGKYDFGEVASDLSAVDQNIVPDGNGTRDLGTSSKRWGELFLSGTTINLGGATISSDGTGTVSVSANGVTLPTGSKVGTTTIAKASANGQAVIDVPFFTSAGGLSTAAKTFQFAAAGDSFAYTNSGTFTLAAGSALEAQDITLFKF
jgi:hypothetical protein